MNQAFLHSLSLSVANEFFNATGKAATAYRLDGYVSATELLTITVNKEVFAITISNADLGATDTRSKPLFDTFKAGGKKVEVVAKPAPVVEVVRSTLPPELSFLEIPADCVRQGERKDVLRGHGRMPKEERARLKAEKKVTAEVSEAEAKAIRIKEHQAKFATKVITNIKMTYAALPTDASVRVQLVIKQMDKTLVNYGLTLESLDLIQDMNGHQKVSLSDSIDKFVKQIAHAKYMDSMC